MFGRKCGEYVRVYVHDHLWEFFAAPGYILAGLLGRGAHSWVPGLRGEKKGGEFLWSFGDLFVVVGGKRAVH